MDINILLDRKIYELNIDIIKLGKSDNGDVHIIAFRPVDETFIVWTSYYTGEDITSYENFYNGKYDLTHGEAEKELIRRVNK